MSIIELLKIYEAKCKQCTLVSLCVSKIDKLCISIKGREKRRELLYLQQHRVIKYLDVQKTSPNKKKMFYVQYKALLFVIFPPELG